MISDYNVLYAETVKLARSLGKDAREVPLPFQLNELEKYATELKYEAAMRKAAEAAKETPAKDK